MKHFYIKIMLSAAFVLVAFAPISKEQTTRAQWAVFDAADAIADALAQLEFAFQSAQAAEDWAQVIAEWEYYLETVRDLEERFGGITDQVLEQHTRRWGNTPLSIIVDQLDPEDPGFIDATIEMLVDELGVIAADEAYRAELLSTLNDGQTKNNVEADLIGLELKDLAYRDVLLGASSTELRNDDRWLELETLKAAVNDLGPNSTVATQQLGVTTSLMVAQQNQEIIELLSRMYAETGRTGLHNNADRAKSIQRNLEIDAAQDLVRQNAGTFVEFDPQGGN